MAELDLATYQSMMVLRSNLAFFTLRCPLCGVRISTVAPIPATLRAEVSLAAQEVGAGMGAE